MAYDPRTQDEVYDSLKSNLTGKISKLTNFAESTFNWVWTRAYAEEQHREEVVASATQLSGWVDWAGETLTQEDLDDLGIDGATPSELNQFMEDSHLEQVGELVGVTRDQGSKATGSVDITTNSATTIPEGTEFSTEPDSQGNSLSFFTDSEVTTNSATTVSADVTAEEVGTEYNVGSGTVTELVNPPTGVDSVTNPSGMTGGADVQSNDSLRDDIKNALVESTGGGTKAGVEGFIVDNTDATDAVVDEKFTGDSAHGNHPHGDVVVLGGTDSDVNDAIANSRPSAVEHILVRPTTHNVQVTADVEGSDIDTTAVEDSIQDYFDTLLIDDDVYRDQIIQAIMNGDDDVNNISSLTVKIVNETHTYDSDNSGGDAPNHPLYKFDKGDEMAADSSSHGNGITEVTGTLSGNSHTFTEGTDYDEGTVDGSSVDAIDWGLGGDNPDEDTDFDVNYDIEEDITIGTQEHVTLDSKTVTVV